MWPALSARLLRRASCWRCLPSSAAALFRAFGEARAAGRCFAMSLGRPGGFQTDSANGRRRPAEKVPEQRIKKALCAAYAAQRAFCRCGAADGASPAPAVLPTGVTQRHAGRSLSKPVVSRHGLPHGAAALRPCLPTCRPGAHSGTPADPLSKPVVSRRGLSHGAAALCPRPPFYRRGSRSGTPADPLIKIAAGFGKLPRGRKARFCSILSPVGAAPSFLCCTFVIE